MELRGDSVVLRPLGVDDVPRLVQIGQQPEVARWWCSITTDDLTAKAEGRDDAPGLAILIGADVVRRIQYGEEDDPE